MRKGFTLIELLVVIAIIGILAAVVLASLNTARGKGDDAAIKANVSTVATQATLFYDNGQTYDAFDAGGSPAPCPLPGDVSGNSVFHDPNVEAAIAAALQASAGGSTFCISAAPEYAVAVTRPGGASSKFWCADSTGLKCGNDGNAGDLATPIVGNACVPCTVR
jgi:prepilin-type N-terminal cleavage/methylation domain-containing protein